MGLLLVVICFALSEKSSRALNNPAIVALITAVLSVLTSVVIVFIFGQSIAVAGSKPIREIVEEEAMVVKNRSLSMLRVAVLCS
jgi:hypothetical protein